MIDIDHDQHGNERVAGEALLAGTASDIARAQLRGFYVESQQTLASLNRTVARLRVPEGVSVDQALAMLHDIAPRATISANALYRSTAAFVAPEFTPHPHRPATPRGVLGVIDTGADANVFSAEGVVLSTKSFGTGAYTPRDHGTIVASLAADLGMRVHVADVFGAASDGSLVAPVDAILGAMDWMIASRIAVINISIEGPQNDILARIVHAAALKGHVIVAAAGNGGPLATPAFPAAYDGAVAVTAIDSTGHAYRRANRGDYVDFAAAGVDLPVEVGDTQVTVTGTSFAAPIVAARIASLLHEPSPSEARRVLQSLRKSAVDLGAPGRDPVFGWGAISTPN